MLSSGLRSASKSDKRTNFKALLWASALSVVPFFGCGGGSKVASHVAPPSNLTYGQSTIVARIGQAIPPHAPIVTGTVTSYRISPDLPLGLNISNTTGILDGTPSVVSPKTTYTVTAANESGATTATLEITVNPEPPSNLSYPQTTIAGIVGQAITPDVPTVTGMVRAYSIAPGLPAGLKIDNATGVISGTPTAVSAEASYTVTAENAGGVASTDLKIAVNPAVPAPSELMYPVTAIRAIAGVEIIPDIPTVLGNVTSYVVTPDLPSGLVIDPASGIISGIPSVSTALANYTVTAINPGGSATAAISINVAPAQNVLLELGQSGPLSELHLVSDRLLSKSDYHWSLWDYASRTLIASGDVVRPIEPPPVSYREHTIDIAGPTVVVAIPNAFQVRSKTDGHLLATIISPGIGKWPSAYNPGVVPWWALSEDGSYIVAGDQAGLRVFAVTGQLISQKTGDYSNAQVFAATGQLQIALGPAGPSVIETISTNDGRSTVSPPFSGQFSSWFLDGQRFLTVLGNDVWVYSSAAVQQSLVALPTVRNLTGQGNWVWTFDDRRAGYPLDVYEIGSSTPAIEMPTDGLAIVIGSGKSIGILRENASVSVIDLSSAVPLKSDYAMPIAHLNVFSADSSSRWVAGNLRGAVVDGASLSGAPRYFGHGAVWSIAGTTGRVALSTAIGEVLVFDLSGPTMTQTIEFPSAKLALSSDGTVLGAMAEDAGDQGRILNFYALPVGTIIESYPPYLYSAPLLDFTMSRSAATFGRATQFTRQVTPLSGSPVIWSDTGVNGPITISPDGTLVGASSDDQTANSVTNIFKDGKLITAVPGIGLDWLDDNRILVNLFSGNTYSSTYLGAAIYSSGGNLIAPVPLPKLIRIQPVPPDQIYSPDNNAIYSLGSGAAVWQGSFPVSYIAGAVAGKYVAYQTGHSVVLESYR